MSATLTAPHAIDVMRPAISRSGMTLRKGIMSQARSGCLPSSREANQSERSLACHARTPQSI